MSNPPNKVVNLTVHKNTLEKRRKKEMKRDLLEGIKSSFDDEDIVGYAVVLIHRNQTTHTISEPGKLRPAEYDLLVRDAVMELGRTVSITNPAELEHS